MAPGVLPSGSGGQPLLPAGSVDVQFRVPVSLSVLLEAMGAAGRRAEVEEWAAGYRRLVSGLGRSVQRAGGYALESSGVAVPARLDVATTVDEYVSGLGVRWHAHVWIGPTAPTIANGRHRPIAVEALNSGIYELAWPTYLRELEELAERELGVQWGEPRPAALREIVEPPWHEHVGPAERGVCVQPAGLRRHVVLADDQDMRLAATMETSHRIATQDGTAYDPDIAPAAARAGAIRGLLHIGPARTSGCASR